jgi:hypothetical protein
MTTINRRTFSARSRAAKIAAQIKAAEEEQKAYDASIEEAMKSAGRARVEFVETLYDFFGIDIETTARRDKETGEILRKNGEPVLVKTDKKEVRRIERLAAAFGELVEKAQRADEHDANEEAVLPAPAEPYRYGSAAA